MTVKRPRPSLREFMRTRPWLASAAAFTGATAGVGIGLPLAHGEVASSVMVVLTVGVSALLLRTVPRQERLRLAAVVGIAVGLRIAAAALLYYGSLAAGRGGFITGDDASYAGLAWGYLQWLRQDPVAPYLPPLWHGDAYLFGSFVYLETALFWLFGPTPLAMTSLNALFSAAFVIVMYDITRRLWDTRAAAFTATATAVYPSLILWSALNLKDSLTLLLVGCFFWVLARMQARPRWYLVLSVALLLLPLESLRRYLFVGLAVLFPVGVVLSRATPARRVAFGVVSGLVSAILLAVVAATGGASGGEAAVAAGGFAGLERTRQGMAVGARGGFADTPALPVHEGDTYVVVDPSITAPPRVSGSPSQSPHVVVVTPGARIVLATPSPSGTTPATGSPGPTAIATATPTQASTESVVVVHPGDIVVVSTNSSATAAPEAVRQSLALRSERAADTVQLVTSSGSAESLALTRTLTYIPRGLAYTLFAPFPWDLGRPQDAATIPEMLAWYLVLGCIPFALRRTTRWREVAPIILYVAGVLGLFVLVEGNVGTLYRHRAMVIPLAVAIASPVLLRVTVTTFEWIASRRKPRVGL